MNIFNVRNSLCTKKICEGFLPITPQPKQSARFFATKTKGGKLTVRSYTDPKKKKYVKSLSQIFSEQYKNDVVTCPIKFTGIIIMPFNKSQKKSDIDRGFSMHITKPDTDNFLKPFQDSLEGILYKNDSQIMWHDVVKVRGHKEGFYYCFQEVNYF